ncbi:two component transcriptional regulator [Caballeronia calidae]|uniref:Two component transcriptional regulator n=1 Tax=Caballeronia calidae TaxID=1777139 RepID=A0A158E7J7_9BURK|nr:response regulator transcription factor [Caballeronia calidae]SAL02842.1 two component transcriptional regulator [Caballeronia calidae]
MRILIAEDDTVIADALVRALRQNGYAVDWVACGSDADTALASVETFDLLILDIGLPKMSGLQVLTRLRNRNSHLPVLILSAAESTESRVRGLDLGADDFVAKPFALDELMARVRALTRRGVGGGPSLVRIGLLAFDTVGRVARVNDHVLALSSREVEILEILIQRIGRLVSKDQLISHLCGWGEDVSPNAIEVYMHRLRNKLKGSGAKVVTLRGLGYCLEADTADIAACTEHGSRAKFDAMTQSAS